jgi:phage terminase large subunit-like protein
MSDVATITETHFITNDVTGREFLKQLEPYPCYGGLDLSNTSDLTAFVLVWHIGETIYCYPWFFLPSEGLVERSKHDGVPYDQWLKEGYLEMTPGWTVDDRYVVSRITELGKSFKIKEIAFDQWGAKDVVSHLAEHNVDCVQISQQLGAMTAPSKRLERLVLDKHLVHTGHPLLRWNLDCTTIYSDVNGNIKPVKPALKKSSKRIDGIIALVMAISRVQQAKPQFKSIYSSRGVLTVDVTGCLSCNLIRRSRNDPKALCPLHAKAKAG